MKKTISLLLCAALLFSLAACAPSAKTEDTPPKTIETAAPTETPTTEAANTEEETISLGVVDGNSYLNEKLGIQCTLDDDWTFFDREAIAQLNQLSADLINDESVKEIVEGGGAFVDCYAQSPITGSNLTITLQKINLLSSILATEKSVLEQSEEMTVATLKSMGLTDVEYKMEKATFAGKEHDVASIRSKSQGIELHQTQICVLKSSYCAVITVSCTAVEETDKILGFFS